MSSKSEVDTSINFKIIGIIIALTIAYQILLIVTYGWPDSEQFPLTGAEENFLLPDLLYLIGIGGCCVAAFWVAKGYKGSEIFTKAYFFLGIGFSCWLIGDIGYYYFEYVLLVESWPSPFDAGFLLSYIFASLHLYLNSRFFRKKWNKPMKIWLFAFPTIITISMALYAINQWGEYDGLAFDVSYSSLFILGASVIIALSVIGASVFRQSVLGSIWLLLAIGILLWSVADIWYVYEDSFADYFQALPANALWMGTFMLIIYALYKHKRVI